MRFSILNFRKIVAYVTSFSLIFPQTALAFNDIVPPQNITDNPINHIVVDPGSGQTSLDRAQNGTPVININAASKGGVSANYYRDFNVNDENLILNNLQGEAGVSKLGGALHSNPNLNQPGTRAADIILNEVTSSRVTNLNGYTEIFGKQAELIIANPNGIMVGGAGFINTSHLSLVTGSSGGLESNGNLNPFLLSDNPNALISVTGRDVYDADGNPVAYNLGIDMSGGNYVDLLSRVVQINGNLLANKEINVKTGNDRATKTANGWDVTSTNKSGKPEFAIDSTALGGIYAGRVNFIATEDGVGVRTRGDVIANIDDIKYDARGVIVIDGTNSAKRDIKINTINNTTTTGEITAGRNVDIAAKKITNTNVIQAKNNTNVITDKFINTGSKLIAVNDLNLNLGTNDWESSGVVQSGNTLTLTARNITNGVGDISAKNLIINADGNFINGTTLFENILRATNDLTLNITGDITNYGKITAGRDANITSGGAIQNGTTTGGNATIHTSRDMNVTAATKILNKGFIQAIGKLFMSTTAAINGDYELNKNVQNLPTDEDITLTPAYQKLYDDLANIVDVTVLSDLSNNTKTAEQYYAVQERMRIVKITDLLAGYTNGADDVNVSELLTLPEFELQKSLQNLLGDTYDVDDWTIDLTQIELDINQQIADQLSQWNEYNTVNETSLTLAEYADLIGEPVLNFTDMQTAAQLAAETDRADKIMFIFTEQVDIARDYQLLDWSAMDDGEIADKLGILIGADFNPSEWMISSYISNGEALTTAYLNSLRINTIDRTKVEQTGIHNDGRIYSGDNLSLTSNSVLHNNKNALIYSDGNAEFNIRNILFNNSNEPGQGIFANGTLKIAGTNNGWTDQLINYDGAIESNGNLTVNATEIINYGSDVTDFSQIDNEIKEAHEYTYYYQKCVFGGTPPRCSFGSPREVSQTISKAQYDQYKSEGKKVTDKFLYYYVTDYAILNNAVDKTKIYLAYEQHNSTVNTHKTDVAMQPGSSNNSTLRSNNGALTLNAGNITNYNSKIIGVDVDITATNLLNTHLKLNVNAPDYYTTMWRTCKSRVAGACVDYTQAHSYWTLNKVKSVEGAEKSSILAKNSLNIHAKQIGNGKTDDNADIGTGRLPYAPDNVPATPLDEILRTGTIDPLANFKLPNGQYGLIKLGDILNQPYLYESDPMLVDLEHYLGSQYLMNRIGIDPYDVEAKFIGDAFVEHEIIKKSLEQVNAFQNTYTTTEQIDAYINGLYNSVTSEMVAQLGLEFGRALTDKQVKDLKTDIVWYVEQKITLPNGEVYTALVPTVYLAPVTLDAWARESIYNSNLIMGGNVTIETLDSAYGMLNNAGAIVGTKSLSITMNEVNNASLTLGGTAVLSGGDSLTINAGTVNNLDGTIQTTNANSKLTIDADELNNITRTQSESIDRGDYKRVETHIGNTATIASAGDLEINTTGDVNMAGSKIAAAGDAELNVGGDLNALAIQDYEYTYEKQSSGDMLSKTTEIRMSESLTNLTSGIIAGGNMDLNVNKDLISVGTEFLAGGNLNVNADNMYLMNATDFENNYYYKKTESFDALGAIVNIATSAVIGGGVGALAATPGALDMKKGTVEIKANYDEETLGTVFAGNNVNLNSNKDMVMVSTTVIADNDLNINTGGELYVGTAEEKHYIMDHKEKFGGDLVKAAVSGAVTGITSAVGGSMAGSLGGAFVGDMAGLALGYQASQSSTPIMNGIDSLDSLEITSVLQSSSNIMVGNDMNIKTNKDLTIAGSNVDVGNDASLTSETGNVNIISSTETQTTTEKTVRTSDFGNIGIDLTPSSIGISGSYDVNTDTTTTTSATEKGTVINIGNNLKINADKDVNVVASGIVAENDIDITAETGNVNVISAEQLEQLKNKSETDTITVGASVGNAWLGAGEKMVKTFENTDNNHQGWASGALNTASVAVEVVATLPTFGFYAGGNTSVTHSEANSNTDNVTNSGSAIISNAGNISLDADKDINITGSTVASKGNDTTIDLSAGDNVNITASVDTSNTSSNGHSDTVGIGLNTKEIFAGLPTYDHSETKGNGGSTTHNNSVVSNTNGTTNINSGADTNVIGANVTGKDIDINVGGDLNVASLQNTSDHSNKTNGFNVNPNAIAGGVTSGSDGGSRQWTDNQTTIIGTNGVNIDVTGNTDNTGAVIANATRGADGKLVDGGNLDLTTGTITYGNLIDDDDSDTRMTHVEVGGIVKVQHSTGSTDKDGVTYATIGDGNITVGGDTAPVLDDLNRDVTKTFDITKDEAEKGYAIDMEIDVATVFEMAKNFDGLMESQLGEAGENAEYVLDKASETVDKVGEIIDWMFPPEPESKEYTKSFLSLTEHTSYYKKDGFGLESDPVITSETYGDGYTRNCTASGKCVLFPPMPMEPGLESVMAPWEVVSLAGAGVNLAKAGIKYAFSALRKIKINKLVDDIADFVGEESRLVTTPKGNIQVMSKDATKKVRIDIKGEKTPHINVEYPGAAGKNINQHLPLKS